MEASDREKERNDSDGKFSEHYDLTTLFLSASFKKESGIIYTLSRSTQRSQSKGG